MGKDTTNGSQFVVGGLLSKFPSFYITPQPQVRESVPATTLHCIASSCSMRCHQTTPTPSPSPGGINQTLKRCCSVFP